MKMKKLTALISAISMLGMMTFSVQAKEGKIYEDIVSIGNVTVNDLQPFSFLHGDDRTTGDRTVNIENGYLTLKVADGVTGVDNKYHDGDGITMDLGTTVDVGDVLIVSFDFTNGQGYTGYSLDLSSSDTALSQQTGILIGHYGADNNEIMSFESQSFKVTNVPEGGYKLTFTISGNTGDNLSAPMLKNIKIKKQVNITNDISEVNDVFSTMSEVPSYYRLVYTGSKPETKLAFKDGALSVDPYSMNDGTGSSNNMNNGDGIYVDMFEATPGAQMKIDFSFTNNNGNTTQVVKAYTVADGEMQLIGESNAITGSTGPETFSGTFTVPDFNDSFSVYLETVATNNTSSSPFKFSNIKIVKVNEAQVYENDSANANVKGFTADITVAGGQSINHLTWYIKKDGGEYQTLCDGNLPKVATGSNISVGLIVYNLPEDVTKDQLSAGYSCDYTEIN